MSALSCYDEAITLKLKRWIPEQTVRILKPDETKRFFEMNAIDNDDKPFKLPLISLSRDLNLELLSNVKNSRSFDGLHLYQNEKITVQLNIIPIKLAYTIDIYTREQETCEEYVRQLLFKLINNPLIKIEIPYNNINIEHVANIRVLNTPSDTSSISERLFPGQFTKWTIQLEIDDAFLFNIPYKNNWRIILDDEDDSLLEISKNIEESGEIEPLNFSFKKEKK